MNSHYPQSLDGAISFSLWLISDPLLGFALGVIGVIAAIRIISAVIEHKVF